MPSSPCCPSRCSPYYTSTAPGAWTFQDVFDIRAYDYYAHRAALGRRSSA